MLFHLFLADYFPYYFIQLVYPAILLFLVPLTKHRESIQYSEETAVYRLSNVEEGFSEAIPRTACATI